MTSHDPQKQTSSQKQPVLPEYQLPAQDVSTKPTRKKPLGIILGAVVAVAALGAGVAFGAPALINALSGNGANKELVVTGTPGASGPSWRDGVTKKWTYSIPYDDESVGGNYLGKVTAGAWGVGVGYEDAGTFESALDADTGKKRWNSTWVLTDNCASTFIDGKAICLEFEKIGYEQGRTMVVAVDWKTGKTETLHTIDLPDNVKHLYGDAAWGRAYVLDDSIVVELPLWEKDHNAVTKDAETMLITKLSRDGKNVLWKKTHHFCELPRNTGGGDYPGEIPDALRLREGIFIGKSETALNYSDGSALMSKGACAQHAADGVVKATTKTGATIPNDISASGGRALSVKQNTHVVYPMRGQLSAHAITINGLRMTATDPKNGQEVWSFQIPGDSEWAEYKILYDKANYYVHHRGDDGEPMMVAVDAATGQKKWDIFADEIRIFSDGTGLATESAIGDSSPVTKGIDLATGKELWRVTGEGKPAPDSNGAERLFVINGMTAYSYAPTSATTTQPYPSDAPGCPDGMTPVSWTRYDDGAILVCKTSEGKYTVSDPDHPEWKGRELNFSAGGFEVVWSSGVHCRVALDGSIVYVGKKGKETSRPVTQVWSPSRGTGYQVPQGIKQCPAGTWPISASTFSGGWVLVCGTTDGAKSLYYQNNGETLESTVVATDGKNFCGDTSAGKVCVYHSPAVVTIFDGSTVKKQHSVDSNYFDGVGQGGAGQGKGSYGVNAPKKSAEDQVRYLKEILEKSAQGRASLESAVEQVRQCRNVSSTLETFRGVTKNREELLKALDSTPFDAVPNGKELAASLRRAIQLSLESDRVWEQWASEMASDCSNPTENQHYKRVQEMNHQVASAKDDFLTKWNSQIAPKFKVPTFNRSQI